MQALLPAEKTEDLLWALGCFKALYPEGWAPKVVCTDRDKALMKAVFIHFPSATPMLCRWHINKDVLAYSKSRIRDGKIHEAFLQAWSKVTFADTEARYKSLWESMRREYIVSYPEVVEYLKNTWLIHDRKIICLYTGKYFHLGSSTSSRVEGAHATLKGYVKNASADLFLVGNLISYASKNQFTEIEAAVSRSQIERPHLLCIEFFSSVLGKISSFALEKVTILYHI